MTEADDVVPLAWLGLVSIRMRRLPKVRADLGTT